MLAKLFFLIFSIIFSRYALSAECDQVAQLVSVEGMVEKRSDEQAAWQKAELDDRFCAGEALRTIGDSRAAVRLANDTLLRLDGDSALTFTQIAASSTSLLDLIRGAIHFISRTPKSLEVKTPYINASIEGTEFVVRIQNQATEVTVLEGVVVASNDAGSIRLKANQAGRAAIGQQPVLIEIAKPFDAVAWALYYPPLPEDPGEADSLARQAIRAIVQNRLEEATNLARQAIEEDSQSAAAYMAQSYVDQALFDIPAALEHSKRAAELAPENALTQARLAEVWLMTGDTDAARETATQATSLDPELSLAQTVLGFASLRDVHLEDAGKAFEEAISLDSSAPLPRLGLGLLKIRKGELQLGREEIETAVLLEPSNALLRSYMGKAYYEEKRNVLASDQFAMAKTLDPNDPTAWFYDSILLQSDNRPVEALHAQLHAIELNDNRGVYRSRQLLDRDEASRHAALGRIYNDLSFEQQARYQAADALAQDPGNHSAHRLLADSYVGQTNLDAARQSELLQSKMTQPLNLDPLQPQLNNSNLGLLDGNGPDGLSYNEYNPLFSRNGLALQLDASVSENDTWSNDAIVAGLYDRFAFSVGQYHSETDRLETEFGYEQDIINGFVQFALTDSTSIQLEVSEEEVNKGDVSRRLLPDLLNVDAFEDEKEISSLRLGLNHALTSNTKFLLSAIRRDLDYISNDSRSPVAIADTVIENSIDLYEAQVISKHDRISWMAGISQQQEDRESVLTQTYIPPLTCPLPSCVFDTKREPTQDRYYGYLHFNANPLLSLTGGITHIREESKSDDDSNKTYPKFGLRLSPFSDGVFRLAAFRNRASVIETSLYETLEPTNITGFNQLYDDIGQTDSWNYAASYHHKFSDRLHVGISSLSRDLETILTFVDTSADRQAPSSKELEYDDNYANLWINWTPSNQWALGLSYSYNRYDLEKGVQSANSSVLAPDGILMLETHKLPASISYFYPSGIIGKLATTYYDQKGKFIDRTGFNPQQGEDHGFITDLVFSYRFQNRWGFISLGVKNLFDRELNYEDRNSYDTRDPLSTASPSSFTSERAIFGRVSLSYR
jgi:tetratricopeptide (TPR) repeat protein